MPLFPSLPEDATTKHVFTAHPEIYSHWVRVSEAILRGPSPLTAAPRELIGAYVSSLNACQYCYGGHRAAAELFGVAPETIDGLLHDVATAAIDSKLRPIFAFVNKLTQTPTRSSRRAGTRPPCIPPSRFAACSIS
jgi:AhpD family alkylhydroperoxidase